MNYVFFPQVYLFYFERKNKYIKDTKSDLQKNTESSTKSISLTKQP